MPGSGVTKEENATFLKPVIATAGDHVCIQDGRFLPNGRDVAAAADLDSAVKMARKLQQLGHRIRVGYAGLQSDMPGVVSPVTEAMRRQ